MSSQHPHRLQREDARNNRFLATILLIAGMVLSGVLLASTGRWSMRIEPDSRSYLDFDWTSLQGILGGIRTPGYPCIVRATEWTLGRDSLPIVHWGLMVVAVLVLASGLRRFGFPAVAATCSSLPLLFSKTLWDHGASVATDAPAVSMAVISLGCLLWVLADSKQWLPWIGLAFACFATLMIRPAYLYLTVWLPILAVWLMTWSLNRSWSKIGRTAIGVALAATLPLAGYATCRWFTLDQFGYVSFAGYNLIGITGQWIEQDNLPKLTQDVRPLAERMIARRADEPQYRPPSSYEAMVDCFNPTVWRLADPACKELFGEDITRSNQRLQQLAVQSLKMHPEKYVAWLIANGRSMLEQILSQLLTEPSSKLAIISVLVALLLAIARAFRSWAPTRLPSPSPVPASQQRVPSTDTATESTQFQSLAWIAFSWLLAKGLLVILVEPALGRYVTAVAALLPCVVGWIAYHLVCLILGPYPPHISNSQSAEDVSSRN
jgi:hypothetical protein